MDSCCLICGDDDDGDGGWRTLGSDSDDSSIRTILKLVNYPTNLQRSQRSLVKSEDKDSFSPGWEEFGLCGPCRVNLEDIGAVVTQLEELHRKVTDFQGRISAQIRSAMDKDKHNTVNIPEDQSGGAGVPDPVRLKLIEGARRRIICGLESQSQSHSLADDVYKHLQPNLRLRRLEDQFPFQYQHLLDSTQSRSPLKTTTAGPNSRLKTSVDGDGLDIRFDALIATDLDTDTRIKQEPESPPSFVGFSMDVDLADVDDVQPVEISLPKRRGRKPREGPPLPKKKPYRYRNRCGRKFASVGPDSRFRSIICKYPGCEFRCMRVTSLAPHVKATHLDVGSSETGLERPGIICKWCGASFSDTETEEYASHEQVHLTEDEARAKLEQMCQRIGGRPHTKKKPQQTSTSTSGEMKTDVRACPHCGKVFPPNSPTYRINSHINSHTKPFKCGTDGCGQRFGSTGGLRAHCVKTHAEVAFLVQQCPYAATAGCSFRAAFPGAMKLHIRSKHEPKHSETIEWVTCTVPGCSFRCANKRRLKVHTERVHMGKKVHLCTECGKSFFSSGQYKIHMRVHTGEKPFVCTVPGCGKAFARSCKLKDHEASLHSTERPHVCDICGKASKNRDQFNQHRRKTHKLVTAGRTSQT